MKTIWITVVAAIFCLIQGTWAQNKRELGYEYEEPLLYDTFPDGFVWGAATAAYQVSRFLKKL